MDKTIKILFLAASPNDTSQLRLDQEMRGIDQALRQTDFRDKFDIKQHWAVRVVDLQGYLLRHKPDIVHFSGHGSASSEIIFEDINGNSQPVSIRALSQLFSVLKDNIRCVILNACYSEPQAQAIAQNIDCVIGMSKTIGDSAALSFAVAFYQALGYGRDIKTAFDLGCLQIDLERLDEQNTPKLIAINCNPQEIVFAQTKGDGQKKIDHLTRKEVIKRKISLKNESLPLKTLSSRPNNLPAQITQLIGRENESEALRQLLLKAEARLVTLTGPGGIGKTSLSLQVATSLLDKFNDGVFFVNLAAISDPALVLPTIAQTLGIRESRSKPWREGLIEYLRDKHLLLVLDNFEQVVAAAQVVSDLLAACPHLKVLSTSRIVLRLKGEREYPVEPLPAPDPQAVISKDSLSQYAAVELFIQRALAVKPDFEVNNDNAPAVAEICFRLEGLPLAIELAAARLKLFSPQALLARLGSRLQLLRGGPRDMPARHQTLRQAIAWSYDLLSPAEQAFFQRLAVFIGGCSLEAVDAICHAADEPAFDTLDELATLIDQSLLRQEQTKDAKNDISREGEPRFVMFETIREFALERLQASDEMQKATSQDWQATRRRHADFFLALAEKAEPELTGSKQALWLNTLEREHDNFRSVFLWIEETGQAEYGLRLGAAIWRFWIVRGHLKEGRERLAALLALPGASKPTRERAKVLNAVGTIVHDLGDYITARPLLEESLKIWRELGDKKGMATVINNLGWIAAQLGELISASELSGESLTLHAELGDKRGMAVAFNNLSFVAFVQAEFPRARSLQEKCLSLRQEIGDERGVAFATAWLGWIEVVQGNYDKAASLLESARGKLRELGDNMLMGFSLWVLAQMALDQGDFDRAAKLVEEHFALIKDRDPQVLWQLALVKQHEGDLQQAQELLKESLAKFRAWGYKGGIANALYHIGRQALDRNEYETAAACFHESMVLNRDLGNKLGMAKALVGFGGLALVEGDPDRSARLFAAAEALHQTIGAHMPASERMQFDREAARARAQLEEETFATTWNAGKNMTAEQAVIYALQGSRK